MVKRHLTIQHKFYIFTDNVRLRNIIQGDVIVQQFPFARYEWLVEQDAIISSR